MIDIKNKIRRIKRKNYEKLLDYLYTEIDLIFFEYFLDTTNSIDKLYFYYNFGNCDLKKYIINKMFEVNIFLLDILSDYNS